MEFCHCILLCGSFRSVAMSDVECQTFLDLRLGNKKRVSLRSMLSKYSRWGITLRTCNLTAASNYTLQVLLCLSSFISLLLYLQACMCACTYPHLCTPETQIYTCDYNLHHTVAKIQQTLGPLHHNFKLASTRIRNSTLSTTDKPSPISGLPPRNHSHHIWFY